MVLFKQHFWLVDSVDQRFFKKSQKGAQNIPGVCIHHGKKIPDVHEFVAIVRGLKAVTGGRL